AGPVPRFMTPRERSVPLDPLTLLSAYSQGLFPMTDADGVVRWYTADPRGVIPLDGRFHVPRSLARLVRRSPEAGGFEIRINANFEQTMRACMEQRAGETGISEELVRAYVRLYEIGYAHSVEAWRDGRLAGGLYGISLGAAF